MLRDLAQGLLVSMTNTRNVRTGKAVLQRRSAYLGSMATMKALPVSFVFEEQARQCVPCSFQGADRLQGHITYRDPVEPDTFWVNPFGTAFSLIKASDLIRVSEEGKVIEGGENRLLNAAAFAIVRVLFIDKPDEACCMKYTDHCRAYRSATLDHLARPLLTHTLPYSTPLFTRPALM